MTKVVMTKERFSELILDYMGNKIEEVLEELNYDLEDGIDNSVAEYIREVIYKTSRIERDPHGIKVYWANHA
jgi:hypothetical protein